MQERTLLNKVTYWDFRKTSYLQIKQGDLTPLVFNLSSFSNNFTENKKVTFYLKSAKSKTVAFMKELESKGNMVEVSIDKVLPTGVYFIEIDIEGYKYPSNDSAKLVINPSASTLTNQIEEALTNEDIAKQFIDKAIKDLAPKLEELENDNDTLGLKISSYQVNSDNIAITLSDDSVLNIPIPKPITPLTITEQSYDEHGNTLIKFSDGTSITVNKGKDGIDGEDATVPTVSETNQLSPLNNKTGIFIGDSITEKNFRTTTNYHEFIADRTGLNVINMGISGTGYQDRKSVALDIAEQPDFISVFLGTNDWGLVGTKIKPLGNSKELDYKTVAGSIYYTLLQLTNHFPNTPIVIMTPLPRLECYPLKETPNKAGYTLGELVVVIKEIASMFGLPVLDLYHNSNLKVWEEFVNKKYFAYAEGQEDGLHPNAEGHKFISYTIQQFLENYAISPKITHNKEIPEKQVLDNGSIVEYAYPKAIYWKQDQSMIINFDSNKINLADKKVLKIESSTGSIVNADGISSNAPYWYTLSNYTEDSKYNRTNEVREFEETLTKIGYTSGRGFEYLPELFKITYVGSSSELTGTKNESDGILDTTKTEKTVVDVDSPIYKTPQSDKEDEDLGNDIKATYIYPKRMFWIKNQSFTLNIDPFDFNVEEVELLRIEHKEKVLNAPSSIGTNSPSWYQIDKYADGDKYNNLSAIQNFVKDINTISETTNRIDYEQVEIKLVYAPKGYKPTEDTTTSTESPVSNTTSRLVTPIDNGDGTYSVNLIPSKISWKKDQSFMVNIDSKILNLEGRKVIAIEHDDVELKNASTTQSNYFYWFTVPTQPTTHHLNRSLEVQKIVDTLTVKLLESDGRETYLPTELKITYQ